MKEWIELVGSIVALLLGVIALIKECVKVFGWLIGKQANKKPSKRNQRRKRK